MENEIVLKAKPAPTCADRQERERRDIKYVTNSLIFRNWVASLDPRFEVTEVTLRSVDYRGEPSTETVMFVELERRAANTPFTQIVKLRGGTAVILPILHCEGEIYTLIVRQKRLTTGTWALAEAIAGMVDDGTFGGAAANELKQEAGLVFREDDMEEMTDGKGIYLSPGMLDEQARFYKAERNMTRTELEALQDRVMGVAEEGEQTTVGVILLSKLLHHTRDGKAFIAWALYQRHLQTKEV